MSIKLVPIALAIALLGCSSDPGKLGGGGEGGNGAGGVSVRLDAGRAGSGGNGGTSTLPPGSLNMVVRDFKFYAASDSKTNPDFENVPKTDQSGNTCNPCYGPWDDKDIVTGTLGSDFKPIYNNASATKLTTHGDDAFKQ